MKMKTKTEKKSNLPINDHLDEPIFENIATKIAKKDLKDTIENIETTKNLVEQYNVLLTTEKGFITENLSQKEIVETLDISSRTKKFDLKLKHGPYFMDFTRDGRYLLMGGQRGQLAVIDWKMKKESFDINVREKIRAVKYLHKETMMAVSQKDYTFIYDNEGKEVHCIRQIYRADHLEYLPYHFLLVSGTEQGYLNYLDVTYGKMVSSIPTHQYAVKVMCQNPTNAIICTGHSGGTVSMWTPNDKTPVMKMLCHESAMNCITIDHSGNYLVTAGMDRKLKIWDLRMTQSQLADVRIGDHALHAQFSQTGLLAVAGTKKIHILKDVEMGCQTMSISSILENQNPIQQNSSKGPQPIKVQPMLSHTLFADISSIKFCPYEDILGVGLSTGISTMFVPGSGEPNFDAFESNPYADKKFRNEHEVKRLLEKIPAEMIHLETGMVSSVHLPSVAEQWEKDKQKIFGEKPKLKIKAKRESKLTPKRKAATQKDVNIKDNLHYERLVLEKKAYEVDHSEYKKKRPYSRPPTGSVLDNLIYKS